MGTIIRQPHCLNVRIYNSNEFVSVYHFAQFSIIEKGGPSIQTLIISVNSGHRYRFKHTLTSLSSLSFSGISWLSCASKNLSIHSLGRELGCDKIVDLFFYELIFIKN